MKLFIVSGISGSGKSLGLQALEDLDIYCIDNLPAGLIPALVTNSNVTSKSSIAVSIDARNLNSIKNIEDKISWLKSENISYSIIFLDASDDVLIKRFKETRRKHPITLEGYSLADAIKLERKLIEDVRTYADIIIDTSNKTPHELRRLVRDYTIGHKQDELTIRFESFGYKHGIPREADYVFDVRCLPNPYWQQDIRQLSGKDQPVIDFLTSHEEVDQMVTQIHDFINSWISCLQQDNRSHVTVAIGCTGGKHRSVFISEELSKKFNQVTNTYIYHRDLLQHA